MQASSPGSGFGTAVVGILMLLPHSHVLQYSVLTQSWQWRLPILPRTIAQHRTGRLSALITGSTIPQDRRGVRRLQRHTMEVIGQRQLNRQLTRVIDVTRKLCSVSFR
ncbi:hypothetical protein GGR52DRAFT_526596 [Hypoxylon sp. FL1284]|nr:hypothetical protein GGR52DRAFT_526596 [Hypoxylon sp. FL1284]